MVFYMKATFGLILRRVLLLVIPIITILVWHFLTFDKHKYCSGNVHQHVDGFLGIAFLIIIWFFVWLLIISIEMAFKLLKRE